MSGSTRRWVGWAAALTALAALPVITTGADSTAAPAAQTITVKAKRTVLSLPSLPTVGVSFVGGGDLMDESGAKIGEGYSGCVVAKVALPEITAQCDSTFTLPKGLITFSGLRTYTGTAGFADTTLAITGGTGDYKTARGEVSTTKTTGALPSDVGYTWVFTIAD